MATHIQPLGLGRPDDSGEVFLSTLDTELTLTNDKRDHCMVYLSPNGSDPVSSLSFRIPENYAGTPKIVMRGVISGTPANTLAIHVQQVSRADSEIVDVAYETVDTATEGTWTGYVDKDEIEIEVTLTPAAAYVAGDTIHLLVGRNDTSDDSSIDLLVLNWFFKYSDT